ncbi:DUF1236 domain-containing protein [Bradyrhizobium valentinum]|uniref:DUF1236 domain-containing protein n=1 Tax=Bradyrhizobium valentinum TaxID=1518501 RepID=A0A0R3K5S8_9BRAD|nr:DUF1236 domain-containing protein [Bradyrhizobium valentinum]KRQ88501.1 hypothetical protein CP49_20340 [Bradyrhizobium valentinum]KRR07555.1 hypothetical protein CQ10_15585 [Bradyrhizobium valentinum]
MRKQLLLSTGIICLMLAPGLSYGQAPGGRSEEPKQMQPSDRGKGAASQERGAERAQERAKGAEQKAQGAADREERGAGSRQAGEKGKAAPGAERPTAASEDSKRGRGDDAKRATEQTKGARPGDREADRGRDAKESAKDSAKDSTKGTAESGKTKSGTTTSQKEREGTTTTQKEPSRDQRDRTSKDAAEQGKETDRPGTATDTTRTQTQTTQTQDRQQISTDKQVRISETLTRERLAPPQRNLNVSIRVGERIPRHVRVQRLPAAIVSIEPEYRGYDYFTTEEEIVIVEPRTQRIVSQIPRDASRIRAAGGETGSGRAADAMAQAGGAPCRIMRRDTAGNITEDSPTTVGSTAPQDSISVTVRAPGGGGQTNPIALGASDGQIVVAMQGGDCTVTIEPQTR